MIEQSSQPITPVDSLPTLIEPVVQEDLGIPERGRFQKLLNATLHAGQIALRNPLKSSQVALTLLELSPANEAVRIAAWGAGEGIYPHSPIMGALTYGLSTLGVESVGAVAAAPLLGSSWGQRMGGYLNAKLAKVRKDPDAQFSKLTKASASLVAGSVAAMALEQLDDPTRTTEQNRRFGLWTSTWLAGAAAVQGALMSEGVSLGLDHPQRAGEIVGAVGVLAAGNWVRRRRQRYELQKTADYYEAAMAEKSQGPQREGLNQADLAKTLKDSRTEFVSLETTQGKIRWPLLTPIVNASEYLPGYFTERYGTARDVSYLSLPAGDLHGFDMKQVSKVLQEASAKDGVIVFDELAGEHTVERLEALLAEHNPDLKLEHDTFVDPKNSTEAAVVHYEGFGRISQKTEGPELDLRDAYAMLCAENGGEGAFKGTVLLDPAKNNELLPNGKTVLERLWEIYNGQFSKLVENHPARQAQTFEELSAMVNDPGTLTVAHMVGGDVVSFALFVSDIDACDWLRTDYYKEKFPNDLILYFPGIATDGEKKGERYSLRLVNLVTKLAKRASRDARIVFQCTNISAEYIPYIVESSVRASKVADIQVHEMCRYNYGALKVVDTASAKE